MRALEFYLVSQVGMFIGTAIFVNAGVQIGNLNSIEEILTLKIIKVSYLNWNFSFTS